MREGRPKKGKEGRLARQGKKGRLVGRGKEVE
jgi:hypothetical protein